MKSIRIPFLFALWLLLTGAGLSMLWLYSGTPGKIDGPAAEWPKGSALPGPSGKPLLIMFVHPKCVCSQASLNELSSLVAHVGRNLDVRVLFMEPTEKAQEWRDSDLWRMASDIPGVAVSRDEAGSETRIFHAQISGETFVYDSSGRLRFHGGITVARGHEGDNSGLSAVEKLANTGSLPLSATPVFGCPLYSSTTAPRQ